MLNFIKQVCKNNVFLLNKGLIFKINTIIFKIFRFICEQIKNLLVYINRCE